ncbi:hypothetical protein DM01DRAFT_1407221 [Hesseltinella vesiculosa]|uniref:Uncharacterized protein n=1 Tax=Hesseltinella vesiculosa TaxID=101127 RepID=A0A1X2GJM0_9FUNG|nr:hypothetical protein DM01DRAFT_1407221 [Hesseltinella vesiculosa]
MLLVHCVRPHLGVARGTGASSHIVIHVTLLGPLLSLIPKWFGGSSADRLMCAVLMTSLDEWYAALAVSYWWMPFFKVCSVSLAACHKLLEPAMELQIRTLRGREYIVVTLAVLAHLI